MSTLEKNPLLSPNEWLDLEEKLTNSWIPIAYHAETTEIERTQLKYLDINLNLIFTESLYSLSSKDNSHRL